MLEGMWKFNDCVNLRQYLRNPFFWAMMLHYTRRMEVPSTTSWKPQNSHLQYLLRYTNFATVCIIGTGDSLECLIIWWLYYCVACCQVLAVVLWLSEVIFCYCRGHQLSNSFHTQVSPCITMGKLSLSELPWPTVAQTNAKIPFLTEGQDDNLQESLEL